MEEKRKSITKDDFTLLLTLLNPIAPHITEELNEMLGNNTMLAIGTWPTFDEEKTVDDEIEIDVQVNGRIKERTMVAVDADSLVAENVCFLFDVGGQFRGVFLQIFAQPHIAGRAIICGKGCIQIMRHVFAFDFHAKSSDS